MADLLSLGGALLFALLPGAVLVEWSGPRDRLEAVGTAASISIGLNSMAVLLLYLAGAYGPLSAWAWAAAVAIGSFLLRGKSYRFGPPADASTQPFDFFRLGLPIVLLPLMLMILYKAAFLPFYSYDAIASWNRWARDLVLVPDRMSAETIFYPLHNSFGMSFPYGIGGDVTREYYAHLLSFFHLLILYSALKHWQRLLSFSAGLVTTALFVSLLFYAWAGTGYADLGSAGFAAWALALYFYALKDHPAAVWPAGLAAASAYLFKPAVLPMLVLVPAFCTLFVTRSALSGRFRLAARFAAGLCVAPLLWNVAGSQPLIGTQLPHVLSGIHGDVGGWQLFTQGWHQLVSATTFFTDPFRDQLGLTLVAILLAAGLLQSALHAVLAGAALLNVAIWMGTANYDVRAAMLGLIVIGAVAAAGLDGLLRRALPRWRRGVTIGLQALLLVFVLRGEALGTLPGRAGGTLDWRPGVDWLQTRPWQSQDEKRAVLDSDLADLQAFRRAHPRLAGRFWSTPKLIAAHSAGATPADQTWIDLIERDHRRWEPGDYLLLPEHMLQARKPWPEGAAETWAEWLERGVASGHLRRDSVFGHHHAFEVVGAHGEQP